MIALITEHSDMTHYERILVLKINEIITKLNTEDELED